MRLLALAPLAVLLLLVASCSSGGDGSSQPASRTFEAAIDEARQTAVSEPVLAYASDLCDPLHDLFLSAKDFIEVADAMPTTEDDEAALEAALEALESLEEPIDAFLEDVKDIDPPPEVEEYHSGLITQLEYGLTGLRTLAEDGFLAAIDAPSPPPPPEEPEGFQAALIRECGPELREFVEELGTDILSNGGDVFSFDGETPSPPATGALGEAVENGNFELNVDAIEDPYGDDGEAFVAASPGTRWVVVDVTVTNISGQQQSYFEFDFKLLDQEGAPYVTAFIDLPQPFDSGTLEAGEAVRGQIGFEVPETATPTGLVYDPDFGEHVIEIDLR